MKKVLFVATVLKKHINVFHIPFLKMFKNEGWETSVAAKNDFDENEEFKTYYCDKYYDIPFCRNPLSLGNINAYKELKTLINSNDYDIIHCHTPVGGLLTRLASIKARKKGTKVIYTAHGFHFYKGAPLKNWLIFYPVERFCSRFTDVLITINREDFEFAKKKMKAKRIEYVPGVGIDIDKFNSVQIDAQEKRREIGIDSNDFVLISVGELNENKNQAVIIKAISKIQSKNTKYIICGVGNKRIELEQLADSLGISDQVVFLGFRFDIPQLLKIADVFVFPSKREGLPLSMMEAMASGLPCICQNIRGNNDLIENGKNGYLVFNNDENQYAQKIDLLIKDKEKSKLMGENARNSLDIFNNNTVQRMMYRIYFN